jgi:hypothetical protein
VGTLLPAATGSSHDHAIASLSKAQTAAIDNFFLSGSYATHGDKEKALATLQKSLEMGFHDFAALDSSVHFLSLRSAPRFQQRIQRYRK